MFCVNMSFQKAHRIVDIVENALSERANTKPLIPSQRRRFREVQLPDSTLCVKSIVHLDFSSDTINSVDNPANLPY